MSDYYALLTKEISHLGAQSTAPQRRDVYARSRDLILTSLASDPALLEERLAEFDEACRRIEAHHDATRHAPPSPVPTVKLDLTKLAKRWNRLQITSVTFMVIALEVMAISLVYIIRYAVFDKLTDVWPDVVLLIMLLAVATYIARATWISTAMISGNHLKRLRLMYQILAVMTPLTALYFFAMVIWAIFDSNSDDPSQSIGFMTQIAVYAAAFALFSCLSLGHIKVFLFGTSQKHGLPLADMQAFMAHGQSQAPDEAQWIVRLDRPVGLFWIIAGIGLFVVGAVLHLENLAQPDGRQLIQLSDVAGPLAELAAAYRIIKGRPYFVPTGDAILALDKRAPILYLRSFLDDKPNYVELFYQSSILDRSLEMKLSRYFFLFGPFVAIGSRQDRLPELGALRLIRSNQEWQGEVASLMEEALAIVAAVGTTHWIKWEIKEIFSREYSGKTLFLFPVTIRSWFFRKRKRLVQQAERIEVLRKLLPSGMPAFELEKNEMLLACIARPDRNVIITCRYRNVTSNAQFLAAIVAYYELMGGRRDSPATAVS